MSSWGGLGPGKLNQVQVHWKEYDDELWENNSWDQRGLVAWLVAKRNKKGINLEELLAGLLTVGLLVTMMVLIIIMNHDNYEKLLGPFDDPVELKILNKKETESNWLLKIVVFGWNQEIKNESWEALCQFQHQGCRPYQCRFKIKSYKIYWSIFLWIIFQSILLGGIVLLQGPKHCYFIALKKFQPQTPTFTITVAM